MKITYFNRLIILVFSFACLSPQLISQNIGINGSGANAHPSALLDIDAISTPSLGVLIPRIALQAINLAAPVSGPATSLLVYNTATASSGATAVSPGYYYWDGVKWVRFANTPSGSNADAWTILGNTGTNSTTNFLGTIDAQDFVVKTNNIERMRVLNNGNVGIGLVNPTQKLEVANNIGIRSSNPFLFFNSTFTTIPADASIGIRSAGEIVLRSNITNTLIPDWEVKYGLGTNAFPNDFFYIGRRAVSTSTLVNYFAINSTGNVGVNTTSPTFKFHVVDGNIAQTTTTNTSHSIYMGNSSGRNWQLYHLGSLDANAPNGFMFEHFDGSFWQRRMTINQAGLVGIGASNPIAQFDLGGAGQMWLRQGAGGGLPASAGVGLKIESNVNGGLLQAYDYVTSTPQNMLFNTIGGNVGINTTTPSAKLHINQPAMGTSGLTMDFPTASFFIQEDSDLKLYTNIRKLTGKGFIFSALPDNPDLVIKDTLLGAVGVGTRNPTTKLHVVSSTSNTAFRMQDGTEGAGKVLTSDANGNAIWQSPSALANYPYQVIGPLPMGANCPVGGTYATSTLVLPAGIYYYTNYSCDGQIGASTPAGFNVDIQIVSGTGDAIGTFRDFNIGYGGSCGNYFTGIVRCFTPCTVRRVYTSYIGSTFTVPGANSENTYFIKIL